jgi:hypothetical protein
MVLATSADGLCTWRVVKALDSSECVAEGVDGLALEAEAEADVGVHGRGYADVGVPEQFLDHYELDALLEEQGRGRVSEIMKPDAAESGRSAQRHEVAGKGGWFSG